MRDSARTATGHEWLRLTGLGLMAITALGVAIAVAVASLGKMSLVVTLANALSHLGSLPFLVVAAVITGVILWERRERMFVAFAPLGALVAGGVIVGIAKYLVGRERPPVALRMIAESGGSFPSGHAGDSAAFYLTAAVIIVAVAVTSWLSRAAIIASAAALVGLVGVSRMLLGVHYPTDVLAGWLVGLVVALSVSGLALYVRHLLRVTGAESFGGRLMGVQRVILGQRAGCDVS